MIHPSQTIASFPTPQNHDDVAAARRVLATEIAGLTALSDALGASFVAAVEAIHTMKARQTGRVIISGIGKSGHVARKIAATMASTGTPCHFVHANEASHGDLGMISPQDAVLLLSNSGENSELSDLIAFTRRFSIPLIALTSNATSTLAKHADIVLAMPKMAEACPNGLAPTTSTTMMLALGDALAVALLERMGLTAEQFRVFHPGGKLGAKLKKVTDLMLQGDELPLVPDTANMESALLIMTAKNLGSAIVVDNNGDLRGFITDGDLKRHMSPDLLRQPVTDIMSSDPKTISPDLLLAEAVDIMINRQGKDAITSLLVVGDTGRVLGLLRIQECLKAGVA
ncbi:MAG: KpsF/GutQ family sugar-phosphate isomerase [Pseudomonadota bacterium]